MNVKEFIGKVIAVNRKVPDSPKSFFYQGELLDANDNGVWITDRKIGKVFLSFSEITCIREAREDFNEKFEKVFGEGKG